jgi:hypothetical protein
MLPTKKVAEWVHLFPGSDVRTSDQVLNRSNTSCSDIFVASALVKDSFFVEIYRARPAQSPYVHTQTNTQIHARTNTQKNGKQTHKYTWTNTWTNTCAYANKHQTGTILASHGRILKMKLEKPCYFPKRWIRWNARDLWLNQKPWAKYAP